MNERTYILNGNYQMLDALIAERDLLKVSLKETSAVIDKILTDSQLDTRLPCGVTIRNWKIHINEALMKTRR